ncbi:LysR family transcriptional regulator [Motilimonas cestriensis]|uniref:LysR family transcriptional regulator n=1 Tax=Motilimonas cestriensis TaxID=2742685 RepID=UPI003DA3E1A8
MRVSLKHLQAIEALAKAKSFRAAAQQLCISQPALSKQIKSFEDLYGVEMFIRTPNGAMLSYQGELIISEIVNLNKHVDKVERYIQQVVVNNEGSLQIGFGKSSNDFLPSIIREFKAQHSNIHLSLLDLASHIQEEQLLMGLIDLAFMRAPRNLNLKRVKVSSDEFVLVVSKHLYQGEEIQDYLDKYDLLMLKQTDKSEMINQTKAILAGRNFRTNHIATDIETILTLIISDVGVSILPKKSILQYTHEIAVIPFEQDTSWGIYLVWDPAQVTQSIEQFVNYAKQKLVL